FENCKTALIKQQTLATTRRTNNQSIRLGPIDRSEQHSNPVVSCLIRRKNEPTSGCSERHRKSSMFALMPLPTNSSIHSNTTKKADVNDADLSM
ncbi:MAG: hypothetical protein ACF8CQ_00495, partial [Rhodopirellula sp. JB044]|uniref:hypothetical protein n=1 Tax=Rhodopirellula sp. JB044 TaxID=3342844 RepID=UPI00370A8B66